LQQHAGGICSRCVLSTYVTLVGTGRDYYFVVR
jgi:hypothetical protein